MSKTRMRGAVPLAIFLAFVAGVAIDGWLRTYGPPRPAIGGQISIFAPRRRRPPARAKIEI